LNGTTVERVLGGQICDRYINRYVTVNCPASLAGIDPRPVGNTVHVWVQLIQCARDGLRDGTADVPAQPNKSRVEMNWGRTVAKRGVVDGLTDQRVHIQIDQQVSSFDVD
jgi:hypothetical protein